MTLQEYIDKNHGTNAIRYPYFNQGDGYSFIAYCLPLDRFSGVPEADGETVQTINAVQGPWYIIGIGIFKSEANPGGADPTNGDPRTKKIFNRQGQYVFYRLADQKEL